MATICIYCGENEANEKDHIPPKSFFPEPRPSDLITVPSCSECNRDFGKSDEIVRNLFVSLENTENHQAVIDQLGDKRNRSLDRNGGIHSYNHFLQNMTLVERYSEGGIYLGKYPAFNLDTNILDYFFERMVRGLLYHINDIEYGDYSFDWKMSPSMDEIENFPNKIKNYFLSGYSESIGDNVFSFTYYIYPAEVQSLWRLNFYDGIEFMIIVRE